MTEIVRDFAGSPPDVYMLRGHHLDTIATSRGGSPAEKAHHQRVMAERDRSRVSHRVTSADLTNPNPVIADAAYAEDLIGTTTEQANTFERSTTEALTKFYDLPDEHPVVLVVDVLDDICNGCIFKQHCRLPDSEEPGGDRDAINRFVRTASRLEYEGVVDCGDYVQTTKGALMKYIQLKSILDGSFS
jgi:hypothetical protein